MRDNGTCALRTTILPTSTIYQCPGGATQTYTTIVSVPCSTGLTRQTFTITETCTKEICHPETSADSIPPGFTTAVVECTACGGPGTIVETITCPSSSISAYASIGWTTVPSTAVSAELGLSPSSTQAAQTAAKPPIGSSPGGSYIMTTSTAQPHGTSSSNQHAGESNGGGSDGQVYYGSGQASSSADSSSSSQTPENENTPGAGSSGMSATCDASSSEFVQSGSPYGGVPTESSISNNDSSGSDSSSSSDKSEALVGTSSENTNVGSVGTTSTATNSISSTMETGSISPIVNLSASTQPKSDSGSHDSGSAGVSTAQSSVASNAVAGPQSASGSSTATVYTGVASVVSARTCTFFLGTLTSLMLLLV